MSIEKLMGNSNYFNLFNKFNVTRDIKIEILNHLPIMDLFYMRLVDKKWNQIIKEHYLDAAKKLFDHIIMQAKPSIYKFSSSNAFPEFYYKITLYRSQEAHQFSISDRIIKLRIARPLELEDEDILLKERLITVGRIQGGDQHIKEIIAGLDIIQAKQLDYVNLFLKICEIVSLQLEKHLSLFIDKPESIKKPFRRSFLSRFQFKKSKTQGDD